LVPRFGWQSASSTEAIRYALVFLLLQALFVFVGTALADWVGRRPSAILGALIEIASTVLAVTAHSRPQYVVFGAVSIATLGWLWGVGDTYVSELFPTVLLGTGPAPLNQRDSYCRRPCRVSLASPMDSATTQTSQGSLE
jgi:MFS family permease